MRETVREYGVLTHYPAGKADMPAVPVAPGVDIAALKARDPEALFIVAPIARVGALSRNGVLYTRELVQSIADQINSGGIGGLFGHVKPEDSSTAYPLPSALWIGASLVGEFLYGKAYLRTPEARAFWRDVQATGGRFGTSIYGKAEHDRRPEGIHLRNFVLESLDFAPPSKASLFLGGDFALVGEMEAYADDVPDTETLVEQLVTRAERNTGRTLTAYARQEIAAYTRVVVEYEQSKQWAARTGGILRDAEDMARRAKVGRREQEQIVAEQFQSLQQQAEQSSDTLERGLSLVRSYAALDRSGVRVAEQTAQAVAGTLTQARTLDARARERRADKLMALMQAEKPVVRDGDTMIREILRLAAEK